MRFVLGIGGLKRSGKDLFAKALRDVAAARGLAFVTVAYADALRDAAAAAYGVDVAVFTDDAKKDTVCPEWGITYRQMLINLGKAMWSVDPDHWVKAWRRRVGDIGDVYLHHKVSPWATPTQHDIVVAVPDVRRLNEAAAVHDAGGINVLVRRPGVEWNGHVTEALSNYAGQAPDLIYDDLRLHGSDLQEGTWYPRRGDFPVLNGDLKIFDAVVDNDADVAALRPHAERVLDMVTKGKRGC